MALIHVILLLFSFPIGPFPDPICPGIDYPAVMSVYDPQLDSHLPDNDNINCDNDCTTVATGPLEEEMYEVAGACPMELLGQTVHFPVIDHSIMCIDTGGAIKGAWSKRDKQCVVYFDTLWHLERDEDGDIQGAPEWSWWFISEWEVL